jgi:hypothetical protein
MDTDDLTKMAYDTLWLAHEVLDVLCLEIGATAKDYLTEDEFLRGTLSNLQDISTDPEDYLDSWNCLDSLNSKRFAKGIEALIAHIEKTLDTPQDQRGKAAF